MLRDVRRGASSGLRCALAVARTAARRTSPVVSHGRSMRRWGRRARRWARSDRRRPQRWPRDRVRGEVEDGQDVCTEQEQDCNPEHTNDPWRRWRRHQHLVVAMAQYDAARRHRASRLRSDVRRHRGSNPPILVTGEHPAWWHSSFVAMSSDNGADRRADVGESGRAPDLASGRQSRQGHGSALDGLGVVTGWPGRAPNGFVS